MTNYLVYSLCLLLLGGLMFVPLRRAHWRSFLAGAIIITPSVTFSHFCVPDYWNPEVSFHWILSPEDFIWTLASATITWALVLLPFGRRLTPPGPLPRTLRRTLIAYLVAGPLLHLLRWTIFTEPEQVMAAIVVLMVATGLGIAVIRPRLLPLALAGSLAYMIFHTADCATAFYLAPEFRDAWTTKAQLWFDVFGVPLWEVIWGAGFGFTWPLFLCLLTGIRWKPAGEPIGNDR